MYYLATNNGEGWDLEEHSTLKDIQEIILNGKTYSSFKILKDVDIDFLEKEETN